MKKEEKNEKANLSYTAKLFILSGIIALLYVGYRFCQIQFSKNWTPVNAKIVDVNIKQYHNRRGKNSIRIFIDYEYVVDDKTYEGNRLIFPHHNSKVTDENHREMYDKLYASKIIKVFYNPSEPSEVVVINAVTNKWISSIFYVIFWNSIIWSILLMQRYGKPRFLLIPIIFIFSSSMVNSSGIIKINAAKLINVVEAYPPNDCRFRTPFKEWVYIYINNERMEGGHQDFNPNSSINDVEVLEKEIQVDSIITSIANVEFGHLGESHSKKFKLKFQQHNKCDFKFLEIKTMD